MSWHWVSNEAMTVTVHTNNARIIVEAPPIVRKFVGQPIENLTSWMARQPRYEYRRLSE